LWKVALQDLADQLGLTLRVCHFPPGTSKWNKIEHRLFSFITQNWRGKPLLSHQAIVNLIARLGGSGPGGTGTGDCRGSGPQTCPLRGRNLPGARPGNH
jgi:hypothetical protein